MQAMAPASSTDPHEGQTWPEAWPDGGVTGGKVIESLDDLGPEAGTAALLTPAATASGALVSTRNGFWQMGQRTFLPAALSGTCIDRWQCGQRITFGM